MAQILLLKITIILVCFTIDTSVVVLRATPAWTIASWKCGTSFTPISEIFPTVLFRVLLTAKVQLHTHPSIYTCRKHLEISIFPNVCTDILKKIILRLYFFVYTPAVYDTDTIHKCIPCDMVHADSDLLTSGGVTTRFLHWWSQRKQHRFHPSVSS